MMNEAKHPYTPITCPRCGSRELAFITEYHKSIRLRISLLFFIAITLLSIFLAFKYEDRFLTVCFIGCIFCIVIYGRILYVESKTHTQGICKNCGKIWILDPLT